MILATALSRQENTPIIVLGRILEDTDVMQQPEWVLMLALEHRHTV